ncbi:hypothetical protein T484DRAFT_1912667 [Baffinella frigidus]|nr:hypothetical protein T484DRAFT_1912667 [Cryptophyta sp. CCMP2293]
MVGGRARREALVLVDLAVGDAVGKGDAETLAVCGQAPNHLRQALEAAGLALVGALQSAGLGVRAEEALETAGLAARAEEVLRSALRVAPHHPKACSTLSRLLVANAIGPPGRENVTALEHDIAAECAMLVEAAFNP